MVSSLALCPNFQFLRLKVLALYLWSFECIFRPFSSSPSLEDKESLRPRLDRITLCSRYKPKYKSIEGDKTQLPA